MNLYSNLSMKSLIEVENFIALQTFQKKNPKTNREAIIEQVWHNNLNRSIKAFENLFGVFSLILTDFY